MGFWGNLLNKKNVYHKTMSGIRVYDWLKSIERTFEPYEIDDRSPEKKLRELLLSIIKDMVTDGLKKAILYKCFFGGEDLGDLKDVIHSLVEWKKTSEIIKEENFSVVFSMGIEKIEYRIIILMLPTGLPYGVFGNLRPTEDNAVYISVESNEISLERQYTSALNFMRNLLK